LPAAGANTAVRAWHERALGQAVNQGDAFAARFHVDRLLELTPDDPSLRSLRAKLETNPDGFAAGRWTVSDPFTEARSRIPPQSTEASENEIDLWNWYTRPLSEAPHTTEPSETYNYSSLPRGVQPLAGVQFDLRGWVRLQCSLQNEDSCAARESMDGIKIGRRCHRLHFLHGTGWKESNGVEIARFIIHYADGKSSERPIRYGHDVQNFVWLTPSDLEELPGAVRAWEGTNGLTVQTRARLRLYKSVWENPRPNIAIATLDYVSKLTACSPFLIAITAE
jgi:hypothetical protein